jgi:hypothetical protein
MGKSEVVMTIIQKTQKRFHNSPMVIISGLTSLWSSMRLLLLLTDIGSRRNSPFDLPLFYSSPIALPLNMGFTLTLVTLIGVTTGIIALFRQKELWRFWAIFTIALNLTAWLITIRLIGWAFNPPPGVDY